MPDKPFIHLGHIHKQLRSETLTALSFTVHYNGSRAEVVMLPSKPLSEPGQDAAFRQELHRLGAALEAVSQSPQSISWLPPERRR